MFTVSILPLQTIFFYSPLTTQRPRRPRATNTIIKRKQNLQSIITRYLERLCLLYLNVVLTWYFILKLKYDL